MMSNAVARLLILTSALWLLAAPVRAQPASPDVAADLRMMADSAAYRQTAEVFVARAMAGDLDATQKQKLTVLGDKLHEQRIAMMGASKDPRADIKALVAGATFDKTRAQALVTEKTTAINGKSPEVIAALADFYDSLNPAQQQKVREFMDKRGRWYNRG